VEPAIKVPQAKNDRTSIWAQYTLRVRNRETLQDRLHEQGIPTAIHYPIPLYRQAAYAQDISLAVTEKTAREVVSLPMHADLDDKTQNMIAAGIVKGSNAPVKM
jgi:UDP-2-acetamido-2-deoxy-ribo-hexuluronate aminotransferase